MKNAPDQLQQLKVAIIYDRLTTAFGGAEQVLAALLEVLPHADLWTSVFDPDKARWVGQCQVHTSWLQKIPTSRRFFRSWVWAMPLAFESLDLSAYQLIISVSSGEAKGILTKPDQLHLCYLLTPTRYLWSHRQEYQQHPVTGWLRSTMFSYLKWWDAAAAYRPDVLIPISKLVAGRCQKYYHRETKPVIYPPVDVVKLSLAAKTFSHLAKEYWLMVGRLVSYKRFDLAIRAVAQLNQSLVIVGDGPDFGQLQRLAKDVGASVYFERSVQPDQLTAYYAGCVGLVAPGEEDFGITVLESLAAGKPVIVHHKSGAAECVQPDATGLLITSETVAELVQAMQIARHKIWNTTQIRNSIKNYDTPHFQQHMLAAVERCWQQHLENHQWKGKP